MSWKIRHAGSPRGVEGMTLPDIVEGLRDGQWDPTDEVMGPQDTAWLPIESHPQLADVAADIESPPAAESEDESRLDMNPLIDVALVLLIFFILTTTYEAMRKVLDLPSATADKAEGKLKSIPREKVKEVMIKVEVRQRDGKAVITVEDQPVDRKDLVPVLRTFVKQTRRTVLLIDAEDSVDVGTIVGIQDAARGADIERVVYQVR